MNDQPFTIVGVMPASFEPLISERFYSGPTCGRSSATIGRCHYACRTCQHLKAIGRLKPGTTLEAARADIDARAGAAAARASAAEYAGR